LIPHRHAIPRPAPPPSTGRSPRPAALEVGRLAVPDVPACAGGEVAVAAEAEANRFPRAGPRERPSIPCPITVWCSGTWAPPRREGGLLVIGSWGNGTMKKLDTSSEVIPRARARRPRSLRQFGPEALLGRLSNERLPGVWVLLTCLMPICAGTPLQPGAVPRRTIPTVAPP